MNNNEIRAVLLQKYNWDIDETNELFPLVKLVFETSYPNKFYFNELNKKLESQKVVQYNFANGWNSFLHGFGGWSFVVCFATIFVFIIAETIIDKKETSEQNKAYENLMTDFVNFNKKHNPQTLQSLEDDFNNSKENKLKIKLFPTDSTLRVGKEKTSGGRKVRSN